MITPEQHSAGATVQFESPFAGLAVPSSHGPLPADILEKWVLPLYFGLHEPHVRAFLTLRLSEASDELITQLLSDLNWRSKVTGAYLAALRDRNSFSEHIGRLLVRSDVCYASKAYCLALAEFNNSAGNQLLLDYLDYYLQQADLWFDQSHAMGAVAYLDLKNGTNHLGKYLQLWEVFTANKTNWNLQRSIKSFEDEMNTLHALKSSQ